MRPIPSELPIARGVALAPRTTLGLGGPAELLLEARDERVLRAALAWAEDGGVPVAILGGGSNVLVPDEGIAGLVVVPAMTGITYRVEGERVVVTLAAGQEWDAFVADSVARGYVGVEALSGIPGSVGATPIQNVGAYGVETSDVFVAVRVFDRIARSERTLGPAELAFGYRDSLLKRDPTRFVVLEVTLALRAGGSPTIRYAELERALPAGADARAVRATVLRLRRSKGMVFDRDDPEHRTAGSFFTNPIVSTDVADEVVARAIARGVAAREADVPRWSQPDGRVKLAAGYLIEKSGITKGRREGHVGISSRHALALVHHGGGSTRELLAFAETIRAEVREAFGVELEREPVMLGARKG